MSVRQRLGMSGLAIAIAAVGLPLVMVTAPAQAAQPQPNHTGLVPDVPRKNTPRISNGEIWDMAVVGDARLHRWHLHLAREHHAPTATLNQRFLASYNVDTGLIDPTFRPTFNGGVSAVEASPDGTKLFVGGSFSTVNGVARRRWQASTSRPAHP